MEYRYQVLIDKVFYTVLTLFQPSEVYSYWLGLRTTAVLFEPRMDLLPEAAGWGQQIGSRVKQNCCCPQTQSITVLLYTFIFFKIFLFTLSTHLFIRCLQYSCPRIWKTLWHCDVNITWLIKPMNIRPPVNSSIAGNRLMNCWPFNRSVLQLIVILLLTAKMLWIYCIAFIYEKKWWCITKVIVFYSI